MPDENANVGKDGRLFPRFEYLECAMIYREGSPEPYRAMIVDIGLGGVQLRSKEVLPINEELAIHIGQDQGQPLTVKGFIRYSHASDKEEHFYVSGFKFTPANHEERAAVAHYVHNVFTGQWNKLAG